ncbi:MAG: nitroreductase family protein [Bacteroidales bacterium]|nr:nitroreductase family protein [Bacteroidales bacterium]
MDLHSLITERWSPVAFDDREVEHEKLQSLFQAAMWAPSSRNSQPWRFIYATKSDPNYHEVFHLLNEGNRIWAYTAPVLAVSVAETISTYKGRHNYYAFYDTGMAVGNLLLQATFLGLFVHQMGGYDMVSARKAFQIPERFEPIAMMAIGYKGSPGRLDKEISDRENQPRSRNKLEEHLFKGIFGKH